MSAHITEYAAQNHWSKQVYRHFSYSRQNASGTSIALDRFFSQRYRGSSQLWHQSTRPSPLRGEGSTTFFWRERCTQGGRRPQVRGPLRIRPKHVFIVEWASAERGVGALSACCGRSLEGRPKVPRISANVEQSIVRSVLRDPAAHRQVGDRTRGSRVR